MKSQNLPFIIALVVSVIVAIIFIVLFLTKKMDCKPQVEEGVSAALNKARNSYGYKDPDDGAWYFGADQRKRTKPEAEQGKATWGKGKDNIKYDVSPPQTSYIFLENNRVINSDMKFCDKGEYGYDCQFKMCPWSHPGYYNFGTADADCGAGMKCDPDAGQCVKK